MKKKSGSRIGRVFRGIINIRFWIDWNRMKSLTLSLTHGAFKLFVPQKAVSTESFEEAIARLKITEVDLMLKKNSLYRLTGVMLVSAFCILLYAGYSVFYGSIKAMLVSLVLMMVALVLAFRYHFWCFQIKKRKLGCSFEEWFKEGFLGEKE